MVHCVIWFVWFLYMTSNVSFTMLIILYSLYYGGNLPYWCVGMAILYNSLLVDYDQTVINLLQPLQ
jgi:hypothetical protein